MSLEVFYLLCSFDMTCLFTQTYGLPVFLLLCLFSPCLLTGLLTLQAFLTIFIVLYNPSIGHHFTRFWMTEVQFKHINIAIIYTQHCGRWILILMFLFIDFICRHMYFALVVNTYSLHGVGTKKLLLKRKTQISQEFCEVPVCKRFKKV